MATFTIVSLIVLLDPVITCCILILAVILYFVNKKAGELRREKYENSVYANRKINFYKSLITNKDFMKESRVYSNLEEVCKEEYIKSNNELKAILKRFVKKYVMSGSVGSMCRLVLENALPWSLIIWKAFNNVFGTGDAVALLNASGQLPYLVAAFIDCSVQMKMQGAYIEDLKYVWEYNAVIENEEGNLFVAPVERIEFNNVKFGYKQETAVLNGLTFQLEKGKKYAFVGKNGVGKSTMTKLLCRLYDIDDGEILFNGQNIKEYNVKSIRSHISLLYQEFLLYPFSVAQNVSLECLAEEPFSKNIEEEIFRCLERAGMEDVNEKLSRGIYTVTSPEFDQSGQFLSGGQKQKIAIARAINDPRDIVVFDEPSAALDPLSEKAIINLVDEIAAEKILVLITHSMRMAKSADIILFMENGTIIEQGTHKELMNQRGAYYEFCIAQEIEE